MLEPVDVGTGDWFHIFGVLFLVLNNVVKSLFEFDWLVKSLKEVCQNRLSFHLELKFFLLLSLGSNFQVEEMLNRLFQPVNIEEFIILQVDLRQVNLVAIMITC